MRDKYALGDHRTKPESVQLWQTHSNAAMTIISSIRGYLGATIVSARKIYLMEAKNDPMTARVEMKCRLTNE